jgi:tetratricopeptide (TPR) repeat protein
MNFLYSSQKQAGTGSFLVFALLLMTFTLYAQREKADSVANLLLTEKKDSNRVRLLWQMAGFAGIYNPDTAILLSKQSLNLANDIRYLEGQSKAMGALANAFIKIGNYPRALELYLEKLQLEEKRNAPRNLASVLMNIGIVHVMQEEYREALGYYAKADSVIQVNSITDMQYFILLNTGDAYNRIDQNDSAFRYFQQSLQEARRRNDIDLVGTSMTGLGHSYLKMQRYDESLLSYKEAIRYLREANDDEILCEATLGLGNLYNRLGKYDSAIYYANISLQTSRKGDFLTHQLEAAEFLGNQYKKAETIDSAFAYISLVRQLNDSINSKSRIRQLQILASNEQLRQLEIAELKKKAAKERKKQLQLLGIGIFIPGLFLLTLFLSRRKIRTGVIKVMGILSLLFLFEYLTLFLHPYVVELTNHTPVLEILIFVAIAAILIPAHHRIEHWLIQKLIRHRARKEALLQLKTMKIQIKNPG